MALLRTGCYRHDANTGRATEFAGWVAFLCSADSRGAFHSGVASLIRVAIIFFMVLLSTISEIAEVAGLVVAPYFALDFEHVHHDV